MRELVIPNPKLKLLEQIREVMRLKRYSLRTERTYCDWVRRYVRFHQMRSREAMLPAEPKMEAFLSDLAVRGNVAASVALAWAGFFCPCDGAVPKSCRFKAVV